MEFGNVLAQTGVIPNEPKRSGYGFGCPRTGHISMAFKKNASYIPGETKLLDTADYAIG